MEDVSKKANVTWTQCWNDIYMLVFKRKQNIPKKTLLQLNVYTIRKLEVS